MRKENLERRNQIRQCIIVGIDTSAAIAKYLGCHRSSVYQTTKRMIAAGLLEKKKNGKANNYKLVRCDAYHDPFGLTR